mmetsp:Transcript_9760/g.22390  ORF Transcript_9760/g.22390 Transcript_9760/m.22390 type:complete len:213 (+) Transcript_9760:6067-6705(+)
MLSSISGKSSEEKRLGAGPSGLASVSPEAIEPGSDTSGRFTNSPSVDGAEGAIVGSTILFRGKMVVTPRSTVKLSSESRCGSARCDGLGLMWAPEKAVKSSTESAEFTARETPRKRGAQSATLIAMACRVTDPPLSTLPSSSSCATRVASSSEDLPAGDPLGANNLAWTMTDPGSSSSISSRDPAAESAASTSSTRALRKSSAAWTEEVTVL